MIDKELEIRIVAMREALEAADYALAIAQLADVPWSAHFMDLITGARNKIDDVLK